MPIEFFLPLIAGILQEGVGQAIAAGRTARLNNQNIRLAQLRRQELQPLIDSLREARDFTQMEEQLVRDFTRASDQMAAERAQSGMTAAGTGGLDQVRRDTLGAMIASLAQAKAQDQTQRQQLLAEILSDPLLYEGERPTENAGLAALLSGLGGGLAGAGTILTSLLSTKEGIDVLRSLSKESDAGARGIPGVTAGITVNPLVPQHASGIAGMADVPSVPRRQAPQRPMLPSWLGAGSPWNVTPVP